MKIEMLLTAAALASAPPAGAADRYVGKLQGVVTAGSYSLYKDEQWFEIVDLTGSPVEIDFDVRRTPIDPNGPRPPLAYFGYSVIGQFHASYGGYETGAKGSNARGENLNFFDFDGDESYGRVFAQSSDPGIDSWWGTQFTFESGYRSTGYGYAFNNSSCPEARRCLSAVSFSITSGSVAAVVPEPASWAMMIAGFGLIGGVWRRRADTRVALARA